MKVAINHRCDDFSSYRAARVKSLFNVDTGANFQLDADLDLDSAPWQIGVIVGPSGSGKTSMGRALWGQDAMYAPAWPQDQPIIDAITPDSGFDDVTAVEFVAGRGEAIAQLIASVAADDVVVLAGKGHEDYQEINGQRHAFSDLVEAERALSAWEVACPRASCSMARQAPARPLWPAP